MICHMGEGGCVCGSTRLSLFKIFYIFVFCCRLLPMFTDTLFRPVGHLLLLLPSHFLSLCFAFLYFFLLGCVSGPSSALDLSQDLVAVRHLFAGGSCDKRSVAS